MDLKLNAVDGACVNDRWWVLGRRKITDLTKLSNS